MSSIPPPPLASSFVIGTAVINTHARRGASASSGCDLVVDVLLEHVLVRELHMFIDVLQPGRLAKVDELVVDEAILDVVELVHVLHNGLTLILYKVLDYKVLDTL
jgi:hypothetical protein